MARNEIQRVVCMCGGWPHKRKRNLRECRKSAFTTVLCLLPPPPAHPPPPLYHRAICNQLVVNLNGNIAVVLLLFFVFF